jgi:hypothetical protein
LPVQGSAFDVWRASLERVHRWLARERAKAGFSVRAFLIFFVINLGCFWWALLTAYPEKLQGLKAVEYTLIGFPVAFMGAAFDVASLAVTMWAVSQALKARSNRVYLAYLSIDVGIAVLATLWVLFAFIVSGWLVAQILPINETLADRAELYQERIANVVVHPLARETIKNVYFGAIMGASAMIPTLAHAAIALWALARTTRAKALAR